jgi:MATE family multidrug resistance protein
MLLFPYALVTMFLDPALAANDRVIPLAVSFLIVAAFFQIFDGAQVVAAGMLRGLQDTKVPMIYAAIGYWVVGLVTGVGLGFGMGWEGVGIWIGLASGLAAVAVMLLVRWVRRERLGLLAPTDSHDRIRPAS